MFCGNIFTSTDLQNHKKNHMKKSQKRFHRVNRALFLSLSNAFEEQKFIPKISPKNFWSAPCFPKIVCGGQCGRGSAVFHWLHSTQLVPQPHVLLWEHQKRLQCTVADRLESYLVFSNLS